MIPNELILGAGGLAFFALGYAFHCVSCWLTRREKRQSDALALIRKRKLIDTRSNTRIF